MSGAGGSTGFSLEEVSTALFIFGTHGLGDLLKPPRTLRRESVSLALPGLDPSMGRKSWCPGETLLVVVLMVGRTDGSLLRWDVRQPHQVVPECHLTASPGGFQPGATCLDYQQRWGADQALEDFQVCLCSTPHRFLVGTDQGCIYSVSGKSRFHERFLKSSAMASTLTGLVLIVYWVCTVAATMGE